MMTPVAFEGLFARYYPGTSGRGVVLCPAFGHEGLWAGRAWRLLAEAIAGAGLACLAFDYPGTGDSLGDPNDPGRVAAWRASIVAAAAFLRAQAGVETIALVGLRLGGLLAMAAALDVDAQALVLLAPFATGRSFAREMQAQGRILGRLPDGRPAPPDAPGLVNVGGFPLAPETIADLRELDFRSPEAALAPRALLALPAAPGEGAALADALAASGTAVTRTAFPGFPELVSNPIEAEAPRALFAEIAAFLGTGAGPRIPAPLPVLPAPRLTGGDFVETARTFGPDAALAGVLCRPRAPTPATDLAVVLVNAGLNPRAGWARGTTTLARRLAGQGVPSLRFDLRGIGDSPDRPGAGLPLFDPASETEVVAALDHLAAEGVRRIVLVGACSGAYLALHAAVADPRVVGLGLVNMPRFFWEPDADIAGALRDPYRAASGYVGIARSPDAWRRVLKGEVDVVGILGRLVRRGLARGWRTAREWARGPESVRRRSEQAMVTLAARRVRTLLVYSEADSGLAECARLFGPSGEGLVARHGCTLRLLRDADHDLTPGEARETMFAAVEDLVRPLAVSGAADAPTMRAA